MRKKAQELWKPVPGYPDYEVSNQGRVKSLKGRAPRILRPGISDKGYLYVGLSVNGVSYQKRVHQLVLLAFVGPRPEGLETCHRDGNPANNHLDNLRYDTHLENMRETKRANGHQGFNKRAERKRLRERRQRLAKQIRIEYAAGGLSYSQLAKRHNLDQSTISLIVNGKRHIEVGGPVKGRDY